MRTVTVDKGLLRETLEKNRDAHVTEFNQAQVKYRERVIEALDRNLADAKAGRPIVTRISLPVPEDHTDDYQAAIDALAWEVSDTVELDDYEFNTLVRNQWRWAAAFAANTQAYTVGALA